MRRWTSNATLVLVVAVGLAALVGCAGTGGTGGDAIPSSPEMMAKEIAEIESDILNTEEMYKASLTQLQMEEDSDLRREVNRLWIELEHLRSRKAALEERLAELEAGGGGR